MWSRSRALTEALFFHVNHLMQTSDWPECLPAWVLPRLLNSLFFFHPGPQLCLGLGPEATETHSLIYTVDGGVCVCVCMLEGVVSTSIKLCGQIKQLDYILP